MNINFTPQARHDLLEIREYISQFDRTAAERVISRIRQVVQMFESFPLLGRFGAVDETREFSIPGLSYVIVYQIISETEIDILTIIHDRQRYPSL